jgi:hypothetical protein
VEDSETRDPRSPDTTLTPSGAQYGATQCKAEKRKQPRYAGFATLGKPQQCPFLSLVTGAGVSGSSPLVGSPESAHLSRILGRVNDVGCRVKASLHHPYITDEGGGDVEKWELLLSLRKGFEDLELFDRAGFNSLRDRGNMIIGRLLGEDSPNEERLSDISFRWKGSVAIVSSFGSSSESPAERQRREQHWRSGQRESIALIDTMLEDFELREPEETLGEEAPTGPTSNRVFVAHGHHEGMRESVARVLTTLGLEPVILHEQPDDGRTFIEMFYYYSEVGFTVVLSLPTI